MPKNQKSGPKPQQPAGPVPNLEDIDLGAALPPQPTKPRRGRPPSATPKTPKDPNRKVRKDKGIKKNPKTQESPYIDKNILVGDNINRESVISLVGYKGFDLVKELKSKITPKEARFLELYLTGEHTQVNALKLAGYEGYNERYLEELARKIIGKVESQTEDHRILFRAMGAGEVFVANGLIKLAKTSNSDIVKLNAYAQIAKILGLTKEQLEGAGGITLIFESAEGAQVQVIGPGAPPMPAAPAALPGPASSKPMMITK